MISTPYRGSTDFLNRFWARVAESAGCLEWAGTIAPTGYGQVSIGKKVCRAHRVAYELTHGLQLSLRSQFICHRCDNPKCVNPEHLFLGTASDNMQDSLRKGRHPNAAREHCSRGHAYTPENLYVATRRNGSEKRVCRICFRALKAKYRASRRATSAQKTT